MTHTSSGARIGSVVCLLSGCSLLISCGGGNGDNSDSAFSGASQADARLVGGIDGVAYVADSTTTDTSTNVTTTKTTTGVTNKAGQFAFGFSQGQTCTTDQATKKETCVPSGPTTFGTMRFSLCDGVTLPTLQGPTANVVGQLPSYTVWDLFADEASVRNAASVFLMLNSNSGDPVANGIKLPAALAKATCQGFSWSTPNIQQDAASLQAAAKADGLPHDWASSQAVTDYLNKTYLCSHSGVYTGLHANTETPGHPAGTISGQFYAFVDSQGQVEGYMDFAGWNFSSNAEATAPFDGPVPFSGPIAIAPGGVGSVSYTAPATAPLPNMKVAMNLVAYAASGTWQTADGSMAGSTVRSTSSGLDLGMELGADAAFPKYRFLAKNLAFTRPGQSTPDNVVLAIDVGYDNQVHGGLSYWPPIPRNKKYPMYLDWHGKMSGNTVTMQWYDDNLTKTPACTQSISLTFDPETTSLTGAVIGYDCGTFKTFTRADRLQGCRM